LKDLIQARTSLVELIKEKLTANERRFILSVKQRKPQWSLLDIEHIHDLPAVKWKMINLGQMDSSIKPWDADFNNFEDSLFNAVENIKPNRSETDVLYELLLKYGLYLAVPIEEHQIEKKKVYIIGAGALVVCLSKKIDLEVAEEIATLKDRLKPEVMRVVFKDSGFQDDVVKTNAVQILRQAGIDDVKSL